MNRRIPSIMLSGALLLCASVHAASPSPATNVSVPSHSTSGNYTVQWTAPKIVPQFYRLFESKDSAEFTAINQWVGQNTQYYLSNRTAGSYRYRVASCNVEFFNSQTVCVDSAIRLYESVEVNSSS